MRFQRFRRLGAAVLAVGLLTGPARRAYAQASDPAPPLSNFVLAGYGTTSYGALLADRTEHDFTVGLSPILLVRMGEDVLFEAEFEIGLEGGAMTTALEYAQIDMLHFERVQLIAGKFLVPFGTFGERMHPTWINKLPTAPLLYGHAHNGVAEGALLPILSDLGAMVRLAQPLGGFGRLDVSFYVTQGPRVAPVDGAADGGAHTHAVVPATAPGSGPVRAVVASAAQPFDIPAVAFGTSFPDNNRNKLIGGRIGFVRGAGFEVYLSGFHAMYDPDDYQDLFGTSFSAEWRRGPWEFRGEGALVGQEFAYGTAFETVLSPGYYVQAARRFGAFEPVVRWSELLDPKVGGATAGEGRGRLTGGLIYWFLASVPVKLAYEWDRDFDDRLLLQWAFGF